MMDDWLDGKKRVEISSTPSCITKQELKNSKKLQKNKYFYFSFDNKQPQPLVVKDFYLLSNDPFTC